MAILIGGVDLQGTVISYSESGGMRAPEQKTEQGFSYTSLVDSEPLTADLEAWVEPDTYSDLAELRDNDSPIEVTVDTFNLGKCKLESLDVNSEASAISHFNVTIKVKQIQQASTGTASVSVSPSGDGGSGSELSSSSEVEEPTLVRSQDEEGGSGGGGGGGFDPIGDIKSWMGF